MKKKNNAITLVLIIIALAVFAFAAFNLLKIYSGYKQSKDTFDKVSDSFTTDDDVDEDAEGWRPEKTVDFEGLMAENSEVCGWLYFENQEDLNIDYPLLQAADNDKYLHEDMYGKKSSNGSIFVNWDNKNDFTDYHTLVYGHNMKNGSMFGSLKKFTKTEEFWGEHRYFDVITPGAAYRYEVYSVHLTDPDSNVYMIGFQPDDVYQQFLDYTADCSVTDPYMPADITRPVKEDHVVTLSTCNGRESNQRLVVHGRLVDVCPLTGE